MVNFDKNTETKILLAATQVFHRKGFGGARMQEIANEAGLNKALLHYYFRSKEKLFQTVFETALSEFFSRMNDVFLSEFTLASKVEILVNYHFSYLSENSNLPWFIISSIYERPGNLKHFLKSANFTPDPVLNILEKQLREEYGVDADPGQVYLDILSLCVFPVIAKPFLQHIFNLDPLRSGSFYEKRRRESPLLLLNYLKNYKKQAS